MFKKVARALLLKRHKNGLPLTSEILKEAWPMMVGDYLATHTRPTRLAGGRMDVAVSSSARMHEFSFLKGDLLDRINDLLPVDVVELNFYLGSPDELGQRPPRPAPRVPLGEVPPRELELLDQIDDEELKAVLTHIRQMARGKRGPGA